MIANYHTHTWRCNHAQGREAAYVESALLAGLKILGFSDHSPYIFPNNYDSWFRMKVNQMDDYVSTILDLRKAYRGKIEIPLGLEMEYYPALLPDLLPILRDYPLDYVILGQHFVDNEVGAHYSGNHAEDNRLLERYADQTIEAMQTGMFTYFAHPDLFHYVGDDKFYKEQALRICREAKSCGIPLEINLLGIRRCKHYPRPLFWEAAAEEGCDVILGRDAHDSDSILEEKPVQKAMEIVRKYDLNLLETVQLRKPV